MQFKIGDKVKRVAGINYKAYGIKLGNIYTIAGFKDNYSYFGWLYLEGIETSWNPEYFELVESVKEKQMTNYKMSIAKVRANNWIVGSIHNGTEEFSISANPSKHNSKPDAEAEAERLASKHPEKTFVVMKLESGFTVPSPAVVKI